MINTNISFKANFKIAGAEYYSIEEWQEATKRAPAKTQYLLDFIYYMNSEQAKQVLNRLPKEDTIELHILEEDKGNVKIKPYFFYRSKDMQSKTREKMEERGIEGTWVEARNLKSRFRTWSEQINYFLQIENMNKK
ncbi:MAG: hypothetical protein IJY61_01440 [Candidatus Gastranaerophilales bacterium]|nr:hypothetical protein [Candidatus Gastranaerophilales bacterium]